MVILMVALVNNLMVLIRTRLKGAGEKDGGLIQVTKEVDFIDGGLADLVDIYD